VVTDGRARARRTAPDRADGIDTLGDVNPTPSIDARRASMVVVLVAVLVLAACGGSGADGQDVAVSLGEPAVTLVEPAVTVDGPAVDFERVALAGDCRCADGSEFALWVHEADPEKVLFFFQGGGACFSALTCSFTQGSYEVSADVADDPSGDGGVFDLTDERNPFAEWSMVFVPYCTGDVHLGDAAADYGNGLVVQHRGAVNGRAALDELVRRFPGAAEVVVAGESAGAVPTPLYAGLASDALPDARITVLADGSGAYPDVPAVNALVGGLWGTENAIPDWPVNEGMTAAEWSFPGLFVQAGRHAPDIVFARHDYAYDRTQALFAALAGVGADDLLALIDDNEARIEDDGVDLLSYVSPGDDHTVLSEDDFYTTVVNGVPLVDWVRDLVAGDEVADVHCDACEG